MEPPPEDPRFLVDGMAVRLGKYLRCLGYDAAWDPAAPTRALARRAAEEDRVLLTRNGHAGEEWTPPPRWLLLAAEDPVAQLREVVGALDLAPGARAFTRCIRCNVPLRRVPREQVRAPRGVLARHERFWTCPSCGTVFWHGSHVANTCRKLGVAPPSAGA